MPICKKCGVEIEEGLKFCPLCKTPLGEFTEPAETEEIQSRKLIPEISRKSRSWLWELVTFLSFAGFIVIFAVDFAYGTNITWSRFPLVSIIFVWLSFTFIFRLKTRTYLQIILETLVLLILLWVLDLFIMAKPWFFRLALPIVLCLSFLTILNTFFFRKTRVSVFGILASSMISVGIFLLFLDFILHNYMEGKLLLSWSIVAFACIIPLVVFLLYFRKRLKKKGIDLQKFFHI
ncbi:MAG TPA: hypothetical protein ENL20_01810 [Candidatus Cloacimonetes bacterium]|nr:hypothetical protein [Candidatus Cloacimonadota bacterium]